MTIFDGLNMGRDELKVADIEQDRWSKMKMESNWGVVTRI